VPGRAAGRAPSRGCAAGDHNVHLLLTPAAVESPGRMMKALGQRYVQYVNRAYGRSGTLWEGRFRSCLVESDRYLLPCQRYIELNPLQAAMTTHPGAYRWSSYHCSGEGRPTRASNLTLRTLRSAPLRRRGVGLIVCWLRTPCVKT